MWRMGRVRARGCRLRVCLGAVEYREDDNTERVFGTETSRCGRGEGKEKWMRGTGSHLLSHAEASSTCRRDVEALRRSRRNG